MNVFPAFFKLDDAHVVVFGNGVEAVRKVRLLAKTAAKIHLIAETVPAAMEAEFGAQMVHHAPARARDGLAGATLAVVALNNSAEAEMAAGLCREMKVPVNVVDRPELCDFTIPSILDRGEVVAAVATGGAAPVLAKSIRAKLEALLPARIGDLAALARRLRPEVAAQLKSGDARRRFWERTLSGPAAERAYAGDLQGAEAEMRTQLSRGDTPQGVVHIIGAGPGDPELLTLKALRLIQEADIVFHDRLVSAEILDLIRRDAERISVGKTRGNHSVPQPEIHELMISAAQSGQRVVRLKGGDPFIFGRGGEELEALRAAGLDVHVVPGISSALGCAASAGLPLTHRDHAQALTFVTGHAKAGGIPDLDWAALSRPGQTLVVFMGVGTAPAISQQLIAAGRAASTPVAVIENGTRPEEIRVYGTLADLPVLITGAGIKGPALLVIGEVAGLPLEARIDEILEEVA
ncbi:MAG: siroheme synthase CysG [Hyphomonadaceae bacterium]|nr:siroheme synthase CysG [Hyphomonadaceae bacterium]